MLGSFSGRMHYFNSFSLGVNAQGGHDAGREAQGT